MGIQAGLSHEKCSTMAAVQWGTQCGEPEMPADFEQDLLGSFAIVHDPREENKRKHKLFDILLMSLCAVICGAEGFARSKQEWLEQFLELPHGIPSHDTFALIPSSAGVFGCTCIFHDQA